MNNTINMQDMRYLNIFSRATHISTKYCVHYNNNIIFCVPHPLLPRALGPKANNLRKISETLKKRIRIISCPQEGKEKDFIESIVKPVEFKELEVKDGEIILTAGSQSKAALLGRNKRRLLEMQKIVRNFFGKEFRIV